MGHTAEFSPHRDNIWFHTEGDPIPCKRFGNYISNYASPGRRFSNTCAVASRLRLEKLVKSTLMLFELTSLSHIKLFDVPSRGSVRFQSFHSWFGLVERNTWSGFERHEGCGRNHSFETAQTAQIRKKQNPSVFKVPANA